MRECRKGSRPCVGWQGAKTVGGAANISFFVNQNVPLPSVVRDGPPVSVGPWEYDCAVASRGAGDLPPVFKPEPEFEQNPLAGLAEVNALAKGGFPKGLGAQGEGIKDY